MTKIIKRPLSVLLAVLMIAGIFAALPLTAYAANNLTIYIMDMLENMDDNEWGYQLYDGDVSIAEGTYVQINMGTWHTGVMNIYMNGEVVYTKPSGSLYKDDVYHFTAGPNCKILGGYQNMFDWDGNPNVYITQDASVAVTGVTLNPNTAQTIDVGGSVAFTATVKPDDATDRKVKWSATGGVTLYTDQDCTEGNEVGTDATDTLTVYAKGISAGSANVTVTSNADSTKSASCAVTVTDPLADAKTSAKADLDTLLTEKNQNDYDAADWTTLTQAITDGKTAIDNATTAEAITTAKNNAVDAVNAVKTKAQKALENAKTTAKNDLDTLLDGKTEADYDAADWTTLTQAIADGKTAIDNATTIDDVATAKSNAETAANAVKTTAEKLADAKTAAKADLDTLLDGKTEADYDADDWTTLTQAIADGKTAIDNATTIDDVATAKSNAETSANAVKTTAEKLADAKTAAKADLDTLLDGKTEADYDADDWTTLTQAIADGKTAIDNATTIDDVATAKSNAEASANAVKTTAEKKEEADTAAANGVSDTINNLPAANEVTTANKNAIEAARKAYDDLTDDQKAKVDAETLKKLTDAETALAAAEKDAADTAAANTVSETINALPDADKVTTADKDAIEAARKAYDDLTDDQKAKISEDTLKKLTDAEKALAAAEKKAADEEKAAKELAAAKKNAQKAMNNQVTVTQKGKKITVKWKKSTAADGYQVYVQYCGKKFSKPVKTIKKNTTTKVNITKINGKKINLKKQFKVFVKAYKVVNGKKVILAKSIVGHVVGVKNAKYTNVKSIKVTKSKLTVKVGKTTKVKAKVTLVDKNKKHIPKSHAAKFRYRTSNKKVATVTKSGKIKGIKKGTCTIYVYAINGKMKKVKVTVK